jgi:transposase
MRSIPDATAITLRDLERAELESLARSMKDEHRLRQRARIVLLASDGAPTRQIARTVGCTIGTASKWRVRYAVKRMEGLDDTGKRGAEPKYGSEHDARILALLDQKPPAGYANWMDRAVARQGARRHPCSIRLALRARKKSIFRAANHGARATTPTSWARPPKSSASIWLHQTAP